MALTSKTFCKLSKASFLVFHASLLDEATTPDGTNLSKFWRGNKSSKESPPVLPPDDEFSPLLDTVEESAHVLIGSGADWPSTFENSESIVDKSWGFKSSKNALISEPTNNFNVTRVLVALVLTAALALFKPFFKNSIRSFNDKPLIPKSIKICCTHSKVSAWAFGALTFIIGS